MVWGWLAVCGVDHAAPRHPHPHTTRHDSTTKSVNQTRIHTRACWTMASIVAGSKGVSNGGSACRGPCGCRPWPWPCAVRPVRRERGIGRIAGEVAGADADGADAASVGAGGLRGERKAAAAAAGLDMDDEARANRASSSMGRRPQWVGRRWRRSCMAVEGVVERVSGACVIIEGVWIWIRRALTHQHDTDVRMVDHGSSSSPKAVRRTR